MILSWQNFHKKRVAHKDGKRKEGGKDEKRSENAGLDTVKTCHRET